MSNKAGTMFSEKERLLNFHIIDNYNINPFAAYGVFEDYVKYCSPMPFKYTWIPSGKDMMDGASEQKAVDLYLVTAGYLGRQVAPENSIDRTFLNLLLMSYYQNARPHPISFQLGEAIEFHFRTPGEAEFGKYKNMTRGIFDPTK